MSRRLGVYNGRAQPAVRAPSVEFKSRDVRPVPDRLTSLARLLEGFRTEPPSRELVFLGGKKNTSSFSSIGNMIELKVSWAVNNGEGPWEQYLGANSALSACIVPRIPRLEGQPVVLLCCSGRFLREAMASHLLSENAARNDVNLHPLVVCDGSVWLPSFTNQNT